MIHAYLFVTENNTDRDGHGPNFHKHMYRINAEAGTKITVSSFLHVAPPISVRALTDFLSYLRCITAFTTKSIIIVNTGGAVMDLASIVRRTSESFVVQ